MAKWNRTEFTGVRYREHPTRKHGIMPDRYFSIRYQSAGSRKEEGGVRILRILEQVREIVVQEGARRPCRSILLREYLHPC